MRMKRRIGTTYRIELLKHFAQTQVNGPVLDIGCHNGEILEVVEAPLKIGIDIKRKHVSEDIYFVQADAHHLPFKRGFFSRILILDVIEHIEDESNLSSIFKLHLQPFGSFFLTTPSEDIRLFPGFLTGYISNKWGHYYRRGYSKERLKDLFNDEFVLHISEWNSPWWRFFYLPIRLINEISPSLCKKIIQLFFSMDSKKQNGNRGYFVLEGIRKNE
jgi:2-polyprenyl-3-methyl-5-hydroxy-6-metoxy-1,4-benzoquinol methylase